MILERYNIVFVMKNFLDGVSYVRNKGFTVEVINEDDSRDDTLIKLAHKYEPEKIIFDLYNNPYKRIFAYAKKNKISTVVFDSIGTFRGDSDIIINESFVDKFTSYEPKKGTKLFVGPQYFLIDDMLNSLPLNKKIDKIAITMGGSDPANLTEKIVQALLAFKSLKKYSIILGPLFSKSSEKELRKLCIDKENFLVIRNPPSLIKLLSDQDLVICAGGRTLYECAFLGRPAIIIPSIEHEETTAIKYNQLTGCYNLGLWSEKSSAQLLDIIKKYENYAFRKKIYDLSCELVDGKASDRIGHILN